MKLNEFKAWFEGYTESMEGRPTDKQWKRIKEQVKKIDGVAITYQTYPVYIDRYWPRWRETWTAYSTGLTAAGGTGDPTTYSTSNAQNKFDSVGAMYLAGKAEADEGYRD